MKHGCLTLKLAVMLSFIVVTSFATTAAADITDKITLDYMEPGNSDARDFSKGNFGLSGEIEFHFVGIPNWVSWAAGLDYIDMLNDRTTYKNAVGMRVVQETNQDYIRLWFGPRLRSHANVFFRPYVGIHGALIYSTIETDLIVPDDFDSDNETRQRLSADSDLLFGYGATAGVEMRFSRERSLDLGVKRLETFGVPQQLSYGAVTIHPSYNLYYIGVRFTEDTFR